MPDGWALASRVILAVLSVAGFDVGIAFLMRATRSAAGERYDD